MFGQMAKRHITLVQFMKFGMVGVSNTIVNYVIYLLSLGGLHSWRGEQRYDYLIAQVIAFLLSVLWSFYWNQKYVFMSEGTDLKAIARQLLKAYISYSFTGIFLSSVLLLIEVDIFGISKAIAPLMNLFISVPVNFWLNKYWTFGRRKEGTAKPSKIDG